MRTKSNSTNLRERLTEQEPKAASISRFVDFVRTEFVAKCRASGTHQKRLRYGYDCWLASMERWQIEQSAAGATPDEIMAVIQAAADEMRAKLAFMAGERVTAHEIKELAKDEQYLDAQGDAATLDVVEVVTPGTVRRMVEFRDRHMAKLREMVHKGRLLAWQLTHPGSA